MKNQNFAEKLRYYRQLNQLSVSDVAAYLSEKVKPISEKSVYSWEIGNSRPSSDMFMTLCQLYHIDNVLETFGFRTKDTDVDLQFHAKEHYEKVTEEEARLLKAYREHPEFKEAVKNIYHIE